MPVPDSFVCPISAAIMVDPVATVDGCVYERQYIERWFRAKRQEGKQINSPMTGLELPTATLMPLVALQRAIEAYLAHRPELKREHMAGRSFEEAAHLLQSDLFEKQAEHASAQDKMKRLRQANKTLTKLVTEQNSRIIELESKIKEGHPSASSSSGSSGQAAASSSSSAPGPAADFLAAAPVAAASAQPQNTQGKVDGTAAAEAEGRRGKQRERWHLVGLALPLGVALALYLFFRPDLLSTRQRSWATDPQKAPLLITEELSRLPSSAVSTMEGGKAAAADAATSSRGPEEENPIFVAQLEQLRHGNLEEKQRAAFMLRHFAAEHAENQIAIRKAGAIEPLVELLEDPAPGLREEAARALWNLARNNKEINSKNQAAISNAGAIRPLIGLLEDEVSRVRVVAAAVLNDLALDNQDNQIAIAHAGAITPLIKLLRNDNDEAPALVMAASLLQSLAKSGEDPQVAAALSGAIVPLVELLRADTLLAQEQAASALGALAAYSKEIQVAIGRAGAIVPLVERLKGDMMQGTAALALRNLAASNAENQAAIAQAGAIVPLVKLLEDGMPAVRSEAARALWNLARENFDSQVAIVRAGAAIPLVALLKGEAQEEATITLLNLAAGAES
jgi:hypothetical protein